jgi:peroxiredoxin
MKRLLLLVIYVSLLVAISGPNPAESGMGSEALLRVGDGAPTFTSIDAQTREIISFEQLYRNHPMVLVFLQTACRSCQREMSLLQRIQTELGELRVFGVFVDMTARGITNYIEKNALPFRFTWDSSNAIAKAYGVTFTPASFLLDRDRKVVQVYRGFHDGMERALRSELEKLVAAR